MPFLAYARILPYQIVLYTFGEFIQRLRQLRAAVNVPLCGPCYVATSCSALRSNSPLPIIGMLKHAANFCGGK
jgi:hypothetical protein